MTSLIGEIRTADEEGDWAPWVPDLVALETAGDSVMGAAAINHVRYGKTVHLAGSVTLAELVDGEGPLLITPPASPRAESGTIYVGNAYSADVAGLKCIYDPEAGVISIFVDADGTAPFDDDDQTVYFSLTYRAA